MVVTDIKFRKLFDSEPLKAICSITVDQSLAIHDIKLVAAKDRLIVVMPSRRRPDGEYADIVHPINSKTRCAIETAVIDAYYRALAEKPAQPDADPSNGGI